MHVCMHACVHTYMHACIHTYMHTYIHTYIHAYIHTYVHTYIHTYLRSNKADHTPAHTDTNAYSHTPKAAGAGRKRYLNPTPYTLNPTPSYTLLHPPTPYTLQMHVHCTHHTLHPTNVTSVHVGEGVVAALPEQAACTTPTPCHAARRTRMVQTPRAGARGCARACPRASASAAQGDGMGRGAQLIWARDSTLCPRTNDDTPPHTRTARWIEKMETARQADRG